MAGSMKPLDYKDCDFHFWCSLALFLWIFHAGGSSHVVKNPMKKPMSNDEDLPP